MGKNMNQSKWTMIRKKNLESDMALYEFAQASMTNTEQAGWL